MKSITKQKPFEEIEQYLDRHQKLYIIGCGTCATACRTGGKDEVLDMKGHLQNKGKSVTGWMVIPTACDDLTAVAIKENSRTIDDADAILVMSCSFGVQTVCSFIDKPVYPALDTLFFGKEEEIGQFQEICEQCGQCLLGETGGICPVVRCPKGLLNGPCGGAKDGKCEVDPDRDCAWLLIYERLKELGRLDRMRKAHPAKDHSRSTKPRSTTLELGYR